MHSNQSHVFLYTDTRGTKFRLSLHTHIHNNKALITSHPHLPMLFSFLSTPLSSFPLWCVSLHLAASSVRLQQPPSLREGANEG